MSGPAPAEDAAKIPPPLAERLFPDVAENDLALSRARSLLLARLLEDGDRADLAWLFSTLPESEVAAWLQTWGGRKLSRRSAAYWQAVLGVSAGAPTPGRADLWPL